jgi:hypothetical protein
VLKVIAIIFASLFALFVIACVGTATYCVLSAALSSGVPSRNSTYLLALAFGFTLAGGVASIAYLSTRK